MADSSELGYGRRLLHEAFLDLGPDLSPGDIDRLEQEIMEFCQLDDVSPTTVYATCFSTEPDDMSQWDRYANNGQGYSVGFRSTDLPQMTRSGSNDVRDRTALYRVVYDRGEQRRRLGGLVRPVVELIEAEASHDAKERAGQLTTLAQLMAWEVLEMLSTFKHPGYKAEQEWRLIYSFGPGHRDRRFDAEFRASPRGLIPYIPLQWADGGQLPISEVVCGPALASRQAPLAAMSFMAKLGYLAMGTPAIVALRRSGNSVIRQAVEVRQSSMAPQSPY